jgi:hypothetical protein
LAGGAIYNTGTLAITKSALKGDTSSGSGGAIWNDGKLNLTDSSVVNDSAAGGGGGILNYLDAHATISNCTFAENHAEFGGALFDTGSGVLTISESTIAMNSASSRGGGLDLQNSFAVVHVTNTIIAANKTGQFGGPDVFGAVDSQGFNLVGNTANSSGWVQSDLTGTASNPRNPLLGPLHTQGLQSYFSLQSGSPALAAGNPAGAPALDQLGHKRVVNGKIDIGAIEDESNPAAAATSGPLVQQNTPVDSALSTVFAADSELWSLLSSGTN